MNGFLRCFCGFLWCSVEQLAKKKRGGITKGPIAVRAAGLWSAPCWGEGMREAVVTLYLGMYRQYISPSSSLERRCTVTEGGNPREEEI